MKVGMFFFVFLCNSIWTRHFFNSGLCHEKWPPPWAQMLLSEFSVSEDRTWEEALKLQHLLALAAKPDFMPPACFQQVGGWPQVLIQVFIGEICGETLPGEGVEWSLDPSKWQVMWRNSCDSTRSWTGACHILLYDDFLR